MMRRRSFNKALFLFLIVASPNVFASDRTSLTRVSAHDWKGNLPLLFEENQGQVFSEAKYLVRGSKDLFLLTPSGMAWVFTERLPRDLARGASNSSESRMSVVRLDLMGIAEQAQIRGEQATPTRTSYIRGSDPAKWLADIPTYRQVRYSQVYPGIDLVFYGNGEALEYDFVVSPKADPSRIRWEVKGDSSVEVDAEGRLVISTSFGTVQHLAPRIYQRSEAGKKEIRGRYRVEGPGVFGFSIDSYDPDSILTIDPVLVYATYLGGSQSEVPGGIAVDSEGNVYLAGNTGSLDFPLRNPFQETFAGGGATNGDTYVTKIDSSGEYIVYSTYVGGEGTDLGKGVVVDSQGRAAVTGTTFSGDFPSTPGSFQPGCSGQCPFVYRLSADGSELSFATFVGRGDGTGIAVDSQDQVTITGKTTSNPPTFPIQNAFQPVRGGRADAFVSKLNAQGSALVFSTFLGGGGDENLIGKQDVAIDPLGNIYVTGRTDSTDFPLKNAVQGAANGQEDAFVTKLDPQGALIYSTYLGGSLDDEGRGVAADQLGNTYVVGDTLSLDFPTQNAYQTNFGGGGGIGDAFLAKIPANGGSLVFSTYLGGGQGDTANDVAVDELGRPVVVGNGSSNFPLQYALRDFEGIDNYVTKFSADGSELFYSTPIGAGDRDVFVTTFGTEVLVAGNIASGNYPILNALQPRSAGFNEVFITHLADAGTLYFAQYANGVDGPNSAASDILLTGSSTENTANATVTFRGDDGALLSVNVTVTDNAGNTTDYEGVSELDVQVPPLGLVKISSDGAGPLTAGSVTVDYDGPIGGVIRFTLNPFGTAGVGESKLLRGFVSPVRKGAINTGVAIYNPQDSQIGLTLRLRNRAGEEVQGGLRVTALDPNEHLSSFITQLFPNANLENFEGTITVETSSLNSLIVATALELGNNTGEFTTLPVTPVP